MPKSVRTHVASLIHELGEASSSRPLHVELALIRSKEDASRHFAADLKDEKQQQKQKDAAKAQATAKTVESTPTAKTATVTKEDAREVEERTWVEVRHNNRSVVLSHGAGYVSLFHL
jgi:hypothetical protein